MSKGNSIIVSSNPKGQFLEGIIGDTSKPGTIMQLQAATGLVAGRFTYIAANTGTDGKSALLAVLLEDEWQGFDVTTAYVAGRRGRMYVPISGEDMNVLVGEVAGTGNTFAIGDRFILDAESGILVPESGSPEDTIFVCNETLTLVAGSTLVWCTCIA